jgi:hypothetical protein
MATAKNTAVADMKITSSIITLTSCDGNRPRPE